MQDGLVVAPKPRVRDRGLPAELIEVQAQRLEGGHIKHATAGESCVLRLDLVAQLTYPLRWSGRASVRPGPTSRLDNVAHPPRLADPVDRLRRADSCRSGRASVRLGPVSVGVQIGLVGQVDGLPPVLVSRVPRALMLPGEDKARAPTRQQEHRILVRPAKADQRPLVGGLERPQLARDPDRVRLARRARELL